MITKIENIKFLMMVSQNYNQFNNEILQNYRSD